MLIVIDGDDHGPEPFELDESDDPEVEYEGPEGTYSDTQLAEMLMSANPQLSVAEIDALLHEPRKLLSRFNRRDLQQIERDVWEIVSGYPVTCDQTRQSIMEAASDPKCVPKIQLVVLIRAVESFSGFVTIRCNDDHHPGAVCDRLRRCCVVGRALGRPGESAWRPDAALLHLSAVWVRKRAGVKPPPLLYWTIGVPENFCPGAFKHRAHGFRDMQKCICTPETETLPEFMLSPD